MMCWMNYRKVQEAMKIMTDGLRTSRITPGNWNACTRSQEKQSESVALSTLHSAKGLEYENVYLIDVNEGVMPYKKAVLDQDIEEERRMFYVGMTRAKKYLHLFSVKQMNQKDADISRFIAEAGERLSPPCR